MDWWWARVTEDYDRGFKLAKYTTPCCGREFTLHELTCDFAQGFGRFDLSVEDPVGLAEFDEPLQQEFEHILGTPLRVIHVHI
jgi:hypothetical protein